MTPLAQYLMRRSPRLTEAGAERLAARIIADKAERAHKEREALRFANPELPFDAPQKRIECNDPTVDF